jgi:restriction system protein
MLLTRIAHGLPVWQPLGWARTYFKKAGLLEYPSREKFHTTSEGRAHLTEHPAKINVALLKRYPSILEFWNGVEKEGVAQTQMPAADSQVAEQTTEELIASAHEKLRAASHSA